MARQKVSGCLRTLTGAQQFCAIRSYLTTAAKHGRTFLDNPRHARRGPTLVARNKLIITRRADQLPGGSSIPVTLPFEQTQYQGGFP